MPRSLFKGDGLYKSTDGGLSWKNIGGLENCRVISKIVISNTNTNLLYLSSNGNPMIQDNFRGIFKSVDAGTNWTQVLFISNQTGVSDIIMNPNNNNELYAVSNTVLSTSILNIRSSNEARVYKTTNGGSNWNILLNGLPNEKIARYALCMSNQNPNKLYVAVCDSNFTMKSIYKTTNGGASFTDLGNNGIENNYRNFGWYFGALAVNPKNDEEIYIGGVELFKSDDGGLTWNLNMPPWFSYVVHADIHCINILDNGKYLLGTDGGMYYTEDDGLNYDDIDNIPNTQFYRVEYNPHKPSLYYGGAQDNGSTSGNSDDIENWERINGGDGFQMRFHPTDTNIFYVETQNGNINVTEDGGSSFVGHNLGINISDRRNWDMPYVMNKNNPDVKYAGTNMIYKNEKGIRSIWDTISPVLTSNGNISALDNSDLNQEYLYAGTSDGIAWVSLNDGIDWTDITNSLPNRYISSIHASPNIKNNVYITHTGYKSNSFIPHIHKSTNNGATWVDISGNLPQAGINDVLIFPQKENLLFVATDIGVYWTKDGGLNWERLGTNMPLITVLDITYNPSNNRIVAGTFAKSIMTIDVSTITPNTDVTPARADLVKVYPSLFQQNCFIEKIISSTNSNYKLEIYNAKGQLVKKINNMNNDKLELDFDNFSSGIYYIKIMNDKLFDTKQIIKI